MPENSGHPPCRSRFLNGMTYLLIVVFIAVMVPVLMVLPLFLIGVGLLIAPLCLLLLALFHYFVWGVWMQPLLERERRELEEASQRPRVD